MAGNVEQPAGDVEARFGKRTGEDGRGVTAREHGEQHDADLSCEAEADDFGDGLHVRERSQETCVALRVCAEPPGCEP